jgi:Bacterial sugar transferase
MFASSSSSTSSDVLLALPAFTVIPRSYAEPLFASAGGCNGTAKRFIDIVISLLALAMVAVPLLIIACLIRIDSPGPILFRQRRIGYRNLPFETLKFRTMYHWASGSVTHAETRTKPRFYRSGVCPCATRVSLGHFGHGEAPDRRLCHAALISLPPVVPGQVVVGVRYDRFDFSIA